MRVALLLLLGASYVAAECSPGDVLDIYQRSLEGHSDCGLLTSSFGQAFFNDEDPQITESHCSDECTLNFAWEAFVAGCSGDPHIHNGFYDLLDLCGCSADEYFVEQGGSCITDSGCGFCPDVAGAGFVEPYLSTRGGSTFTFNVGDVSLTLESGQRTPGSMTSTSDEEGGFCDGDYVQWDYVQRACLPKVDYFAAGARVLPFHDIASKGELAAFRESLMAEASMVENRMSATIDDATSRAADIVADNQRTLTDISNKITLWQANVTGHMAGVRAGLDTTLEEGVGQAISTALETLGELEDTLETVTSNVADTFSVFEHTPFMDHSLPVYRWGEWSSYAQCCGWFNGNSPTLFGGIHPSHWGDAWGHGRAHQLNGDKNSLRTLFNKRGYCGWQCTATAQQWRSYSSTNSRHFGVLFRIRNTGSSHINWRLSYRYSCYSGWGEHASVTLNGGDNWWSGGTNTAYSHVHVNLNIPPNRISTVIVISGSSQESGDFRTTLMGFQDNCLRLPSGLEYVDDMDYVQGSWST